MWLWVELTGFGLQVPSLPERLLLGGIRTQKESAPFHGPLSTTLYIMESRHYIGWRDCPEFWTSLAAGGFPREPV